MSRIHVLAATGPNTYEIVVHAAVPVASNAVGVPWSTCLQNAGLNTTTMAAGQIEQAEADAIAAGTVIEGRFSWTDSPAWTSNQRQADLDARATQLIADLGARLQARLKYFGFTRE